MTWPNSRNFPPEWPATVRFGWLALAAGAAGHLPALAFRGFPAPVLTDLWRYFAAQMGSDQVLSLGELGAPKKLTRSGGKLLLVLAPDLVAYARIVWMLPLHGGIQGKPGVCLTIFVRVEEGERVDDPGTTLVLHGNETEIAAVVPHLRYPAPPPSRVERLKQPVPVQINGGLEALLAARLARYRDLKVVCGLLAGACMLSPRQSPLRVEASDYQEVLELLRSPVVRGADDVFDPLAVAMVGRANLYLKTSRVPQTPARPARIEQTGAVLNNFEHASRQITRRELVDLGDPHGKTIGNLLKALLEKPNGHSCLSDLGLIKDVVPGSWPSRNPEDRAKLLIHWTYKQVRTHFHKLQTAGLISSTRHSGNAACVYVLPEVLTRSASAFANLPSVNEIRDVLASEEQQRLLPAAVSLTECPPFAQPEGQTEINTPSDVDVESLPVAHGQEHLKGESS